MKTRLIIVCATFVAFEPFAQGITDKAYIDHCIYWDAKKPISELEARVERLEQLCSYTNQPIRGADKAVTNAVSELDNHKKKEIETARKGIIAFWVSIPSAIIILIFLTFLFWVPKSSGRPENIAKSDERKKCPRCGWEHDSNDTVCKNPNCKTQF